MNSEIFRKIEQEVCAVRGIHEGDLDDHMLDLVFIWDLYNALQKRDPDDTWKWSDINKVVRFYYHRLGVPGMSRSETSA